MQQNQAKCCSEHHDHHRRKQASRPGIHPKPANVQQKLRGKGSALPEYLEAHEVQALIAAAPHARAKLLMLTQWRAGLRVSEALALEKRDLFLDSDRPTLRVRRGKGNKARIVPLHPELQTALIAATSYGAVGQGRLIDVSRTTAWRWVQAAAQTATERGQLATGRHVGTHTHGTHLAAVVAFEPDGGGLYLSGRNVAVVGHGLQRVGEFDRWGSLMALIWFIRWMMSFRVRNTSASSMQSPQPARTPPGSSSSRRCWTGPGH